MISKASVFFFHPYQTKGKLETECLGEAAYQRPSPFGFSEISGRSLTDTFSHEKPNKLSDPLTLQLVTLI